MYHIRVTITKSQYNGAAMFTRGASLVVIGALWGFAVFVYR